MGINDSLWLTVLIEVEKCMTALSPQSRSSPLISECLKLTRSVDQERLQSGSLILAIVISLLQYE